MNTFDGCCGSCVHMNTNDYVGHKDHCYCTYRRQYYNLDERKCRYYEYDKYKDYYDLNHRWHVVTAIFNKLNLKDSYECINTLHSFRINYLDNNPKYKELLNQYDIIGPIIAECLTNDPDSEILCKRLIEFFLSDILDLIHDNKNEEALGKYTEMINILRFFYDKQIVEYQSEKQKTR